MSYIPTEEEMENYNNRVRSDWWLSNTEYYRKRADIIEEVKDCKIELTFKDTANLIGEVNNGQGARNYYINIQTPHAEYIPRKTAVYHELGHALWDSFVSGSIRICTNWANQTIDELLDFYKITNVNKTIGNMNQQISQSMINIQENIRRFSEKTYHICFNVLEDQRIESLTSKVWLATEDMFIDARRKLLVTVPPMPDSPHDKLLASRFYGTDKVHDIWNQAIIDVEGTSMTGALIQIHKLKTEIDGYIANKLRELLKKAQEIEQQSQQCPTPEEENEIRECMRNGNPQEQEIEGYNQRINRYEEAMKENKENFTEQELKEREKLMERFKKYREKALQKTEQGSKTKEEKENAKKLEALGKLKEELSKLEEESMECNNGSTGETENYGSHANVSTVSENEIQETPESILEELENDPENAYHSSVQQARREVEVIKEKIANIGMPKEPAHIVRRERPDCGKPTIDINIVKALNSVLKRIKAKKRNNLSQDGVEVSIDDYVQAKHKGFGDYMVSETVDRGLDIIVSVDCSGSMNYSGRIGIVKNLCATMFKSIDKIPEVRLEIHLWSASESGDVLIDVVKSLEECNKIGIDEHYPFTPTHEAVRLGAKAMSERGGKKLFILLTDGYPQYYIKGEEIAREMVVKMTQREFRKARKWARNMMAINVEPRAETRKILKSIFKKNYIEFQDTETASKFIMREFRNMVIKTIRR